MIKFSGKAFTLISCIRFVREGHGKMFKKRGENTEIRINRIKHFVFIQTRMGEEFRGVGFQKFQRITF